MTQGASTTSTTGAIEIDLQPEPSAWRESLRIHSPHAAREQLGIPNDRPIVFSGHQPVVFHNGILAKLIAQYEIAQSSGAGRVWIVADQDDVDLETVRVPAGSGLSLSSREVQILEPCSTPMGVPSASLPTREPLDADDERLNGFAEYLRGYAHETSLAKQFANATIQLACDRLGIDPPKLIYASELLQSGAIWEVLQAHLIADPSACVNTYNAAVANHPGARVRPLSASASSTELPLWGLRDERSRVAISTKNIDQFSPEQLAPRGLLMSGLVRTHLGELFIHGTGGWRYDQITQDWMHAWLGVPPNPMALATATVRLPLGIAPEDAIDLKQAQWRHHHARHHPALVGDDDAQHERDRLVEQIEQAQANDQDPDPLFHELTRVLESHRTRNKPELDKLEARIEHARTHATQIELANDRTWAFPLFEDDALHALKDRIHEALR